MASGDARHHRRASHAQVSFHVVLNDFAPSSLDITVYFFLHVPYGCAELLERHRSLLEILGLAARLEVRFAFPTQTVEVERLPRLY